MMTVAPSVIDSVLSALVNDLVGWFEFRPIQIYSPLYSSVMRLQISLWFVCFNFSALSFTNFESILYL